MAHGMGTRGSVSCPLGEDVGIRPGHCSTHRHTMEGAGTERQGSWSPFPADRSGGKSGPTGNLVRAPCWAGTQREAMQTGALVTRHCPQHPLLHTVSRQSIPGGQEPGERAVSMSHTPLGPHPEWVRLPEAPCHCERSWPGAEQAPRRQDPIRPGQSRD